MAVHASLSFKWFLHFRQIISRLTSLCETNRLLLKSISSRDNAVPSGLANFREDTLFFYSPGADKCAASQPAAVNNGFAVYLQRVVACELALIINVAPFRRICRLLRDLADKCVALSPRLTEEKKKRKEHKINRRKTSFACEMMSKTNGRDIFHGDSWLNGVMAAAHRGARACRYHANNKIKDWKQSEEGGWERDWFLSHHFWSIKLYLSFSLLVRLTSHTCFLTGH